MPKQTAGQADAAGEAAVQQLGATDLLSDTSDLQTRAAAFELAAFSFRYPDATLAGALASGEYADAFQEIADALDIALPDDTPSILATYKGQDPDALLHTLRAEATRLFVGAPEPCVSPYEGVWRAEDDGVQALLFVNPHSMAVERFMRSCGVGQPEGTNEPLDHVATELEFLMYLDLLASGVAEPAPGTEAPEDGWDGARARFLEEHARTWMPRFADDAASETREGFYRVAGEMLKGIINWMEILKLK